MSEKLSIELINKAKAGDEQAILDIVNSCEFIVISEVNKINNIPDSEKEDLKQIGRYTVFTSIFRFDESYGASFETFATICVHNKLLDAIKVIPSMVLEEPDDENSPIAVPSITQDDELLIKVLKKLFTDTEFKILMMWNYDYSYKEIIEKLDVTQSKIANTITKLKHLKEEIKKEAGL